MNINVKTLQRADNILRKQKGVYSATMRVESGDGSFVWTTGTTNQIDGKGHAAATKAILAIIKAALKVAK